MTGLLPAINFLATRTHTIPRRGVMGFSSMQKKSPLRGPLLFFSVKKRTSTFKIKKKWKGGSYGRICDTWRVRGDEKATSLFLLLSISYPEYNKHHDGDGQLERQI